MTVPWTTVVQLNYTLFFRACFIRAPRLRLTKNIRKTLLFVFFLSSLECSMNTRTVVTDFPDYISRIVESFKVLSDVFQTEHKMQNDTPFLFTSICYLIIFFLFCTSLFHLLECYWSGRTIWLTLPIRRKCGYYPPFHMKPLRVWQMH